MKVIAFCPSGTASGGTELMHQLCYKLNLFGFDAFIYYFGDDDGMPVVHPHFVKYNVPRIEKLTDSSEICYVYPELIASSLMGIKDQLPKSRHIMWWLSVDNAGMTEELEKQLSEDSDLIHFVQSYYAWDYVENKLHVPKERLYYLSDYINTGFLNIENEKDREDVVLFNPRKGYERTSKLIKHSDYHIKWQALSGIIPGQIPDILKKAKVYIDFGNHPGKDRFPREAVACGCRVITGRRGSAANDRDVPIDGQLKIDDDAEDGVILNIIKWLMENYDRSAGLYEEYDRMIKEEFHVFETDTLRLFSMICSRDADGIDMSEEDLKNKIISLVSSEDYPLAFYYLTVNRMKENRFDDDMMILEGYTRLGLKEEQEALYLMNRITESSPQNYEAWLIKGRALMIISPEKANESFDNALRYSKGTEDEDYISETVRLIRG